MRGSPSTSCVLAAGLIAALLTGVTSPAGAAGPPRLTTASAPAPTDVVHGAKSTTGRLAANDPAVLAATSTAPAHVVVKLDYDSLIAYRGDVEGYPATSPAVTGKAFSASSAASKKYAGYVAGVEKEFTDALQTAIGGAVLGQRLRTTYGGIALTLPADRAKDLLGLPGVAAVQSDALAQPQTDASPSFIGATSLYPQLGGTDNAGKGVIVGILDTGVWPEHASFTDNGNLSAPPAKADGTPRACDFGDNPLTPASDTFACNHKLIGGKGFLATYSTVFEPEAYGFTARDSGGHGTHTASTSAGNRVASAAPLGIERGPVNGIAPGAWVSVYKVCGAKGCFASDSAAAVAQAIQDGVRVINFSVSGGAEPYSDPVELAFLDAYAAGVLVSASAGNSGPAAGTTDHRGPWVMTVAASTQKRAFRSTLTLTSSDGTSAVLTGASITPGIAAPLPVVLASAAPYSDDFCTAPAAAGTFTGKIVVCKRSPNRILKGYNVLQGGAAGMILYNPAPADALTDNHWLPAIHLADGAELTAYLAAHPDVTASFTQGTKVEGQGDTMASFSSRGPGGDFLKPDVTAPGVSILAGNTPTPDDPSLGPPGNYAQAIAGTSMSAPHVAGSAALLLALNPTWTPGQIKSALETTGVTQVRKQDQVTAADPFDMGGGRIDLTRAGNPGLTFDETAADFAGSAADPSGRIDLNLPSVNAPVMPGAISTVRTARNSTAQKLIYKVTTTSSPGTQIKVTPSSFPLEPGASIDLAIAITALDAPVGQYFGSITLDEKSSARDVRLPVAFYRQQGAVALTQSCSPTTIAKTTGTSTCQVGVQNNSEVAADVDLVTRLSNNLKLGTVAGATPYDSHTLFASATLAAPGPVTPSIDPGSLAGYIPLDAFGIAPIPVGDEQGLNFTVPDFVYAGDTYNRLGITSNGYAVVGGSTDEDIVCCDLTQLPDPDRPNNVLAPFWTDLDGTGAPGVYIATLTDGTDVWIVVEWRLNVFGTTSLQAFQTWIGVNGSEDITFAYDPGNLPTVPAGQGFLVGAENADGSRGDQLPPGTSPSEDLRVTSAPGAPGGSLAYSYTVRGVNKGVGSATTTMLTPAVRGATSVATRITVS